MLSRCQPASARLFKSKSGNAEWGPHRISGFGRGRRINSCSGTLEELFSIAVSVPCAFPHCFQRRSGLSLSDASRRLAREQSECVCFSLVDTHAS